MKSLTKTKEYQYCLNILPEVSRTFAIGIKMLKGDIRISVMCAYLYCRIIDTIEDSPINYNKKPQIFQEFLDNFGRKSLSKNYIDNVQLIEGSPKDIELYKNLVQVNQLYDTLSLEIQNIIKKYVKEMTQGMNLFTQKYLGGLKLKNLDEFNEYCYFVAGVVGLMLTDLWSTVDCFKNKKNALYPYAIQFGRTLQTVNILKDIYADYKNENNIYIPADLLEKARSGHQFIINKKFYQQNISVLKIMMGHAEKDMLSAFCYIKSIKYFHLRIRFFCFLPLLMAKATLNLLKQQPENVLKNGEVKISRKTVKKIMLISMIYTLFPIFANIFLKN